MFLHAYWVLWLITSIEMIINNIKVMMSRLLLLITGSENLCKTFLSGQMSCSLNVASALALKYVVAERNDGLGLFGTLIKNTF